MASLPVAQMRIEEHSLAPQHMSFTMMGQRKVEQASSLLHLI